MNLIASFLIFLTGLITGWMLSASSGGSAENPAPTAQEIEMILQRYQQDNFTLRQKDHYSRAIVESSKAF